MNTCRNMSARALIFAVLALIVVGVHAEDDPTITLARGQQAVSTTSVASFGKRVWHRICVHPLCLFIKLNVRVSIASLRAIFLLQNTTVA
jgi:hypothetical protein